MSDDQELLAAFREGYDFGEATVQGFTTGGVEETFDEYMERLPDAEGRIRDYAEKPPR